MSEMYVEFSFDDEKLQQRGKDRAAVYSQLKKEFTELGVPCTADGDILRFTGTGRNEDYGHIRLVVLELMLFSDWFEACATRCLFVENGVRSDLISQIPRAKYVYEYGMQDVNEKFPLPEEPVKRKKEIYVEFSFDDEKLQRWGRDREAVYNMLKDDFTEMGVPCTADGDILRFTGTGENVDEDYGSIWVIITELIDSDWFGDCVTYCRYVENGTYEDIIPAIPKMKRALAAGRAEAKMAAYGGVRGQYA